jgi:tetratricopeptide (TPR) repeat protein
MGRRDESIRMYEDTLKLRRKVLGTAHHDTILTMHGLAKNYSEVGRLKEAIEMQEETLALSERVNGLEDHNTLLTKLALANSYFTSGRRDDALKMREEVVAIRREVSGPRDNNTLSAMHALVTSYSAAGRSEDAQRLRDELAGSNAGNPGIAIKNLKDAALQTWFGKEAEYDVADRPAKLACLRPIADAGMREAVLTLARKAAELGKGNRKTQAWLQMTLGMAEYRNGSYQEAEAILGAVPGIITHDTYLPEVIEGTAGFYRAMSLFQLGRKDDARNLFTVTRVLMKPFPADENNPFAGGADQDDLILWLAYGEAKALLGEGE